MWKSVAPLAVAVIAGACATPAPSAPTASDTSPTATTEPAPTPAGSTASATDAPGTTPPFPAFSAPFPDDGWSVAASFDGTGDVHRAASNGQAKAGALIDVAFVCDANATITIRVRDAQATDGQLSSLTTACTPGGIDRVTLPSISSDTTLVLDATVDAPVHFWAKLGVPTDHLAPAG